MLHLIFGGHHIGTLVLLVNGKRGVEIALACAGCSEAMPFITLVLK